MEISEERSPDCARVKERPRTVCYGDITLYLLPNSEGDGNELVPLLLRPVHSIPERRDTLLKFLRDTDYGKRIG